MSEPKFRAFTTRSNGGLISRLVNEVYITQAAVASPEHLSDQWKYVALWDTGATNSMVTPVVAQRSGLIQMGMTRVHTAGGALDETPTYVIDLYLPNRVAMTSLPVSEGHFIGADVLIGMDIINHGDFSVSNFEGKTVFSFRIPSVQEIDYVHTRVSVKRRKPKRRR